MVGSFFARKSLRKQINVFMGELHKMHPNYMANLLSAMTLLRVITQNYTMQFFNELKKTSRSYLIKVEMEICVWVEWVIKLSSIILIQVVLCQIFNIYTYCHQLTQNILEYNNCLLFSDLHKLFWNSKYKFCKFCISEQFV